MSVSRVGHWTRRSSAMHEARKRHDAAALGRRRGLARLAPLDGRRAASRRSRSRRFCSRRVMDLSEAGRSRRGWARAPRAPALFRRRAARPGLTPRSASSASATSAVSGTCVSCCACVSEGRAARSRRAPGACAALPFAVLWTWPRQPGALSAFPYAACGGRTSGSTCAPRRGPACFAATCSSGSSAACTPRMRG